MDVAATWSARKVTRLRDGTLLQRLRHHPRTVVSQEEFSEMAEELPEKLRTMIDGTISKEFKLTWTTLPIVEDDDSTDLGIRYIDSYPSKDFEETYTSEHAQEWLRRWQDCDKPSTAGWSPTSNPFNDGKRMAQNLDNFQLYGLRRLPNDLWLVEGARWNSDDDALCAWSGGRQTSEYLDEDYEWSLMDDLTRMPANMRYGQEDGLFRSLMKAQDPKAWVNFAEQLPPHALVTICDRSKGEHQLLRSELMAALHLLSDGHHAWRTVGHHTIPASPLLKPAFPNRPLTLQLSQVFVFSFHGLQARILQFHWQGDALHIRRSGYFNLPNDYAAIQRDDSELKLFIRYMDGIPKGDTLIEFGNKPLPNRIPASLPLSPGTQAISVDS